MHETAKRIRNVALVGHRGSGKTSLAEAILFESGQSQCDVLGEHLQQRVGGVDGSGAECGAGPVKATLRRRDLPPPDCSDQFGVVGFSLIRVGPRESGQGTIQLLGLAGVARDHGSAAGAGVPLRQQVANDAGVICQSRRIDGVERDGAFHVPELPHVILSLTNGGPPQEWIAHSLQGLLIFDDPLALVSVPGRIAVHVAGQH